MKNILKGITFWIVVITFILLMTTIGQALARLITMDLVMTVVYIALGYSFIYILKN